jgi:hypothetical protein
MSLLVGSRPVRGIYSRGSCPTPVFVCVIEFATRLKEAGHGSPYVRVQKEEPRVIIRDYSMWSTCGRTSYTYTLGHAHHDG